MARQLRTIEVDNQGLLIRWLLTLAVLILLGGLYGWYQYLHKGPYRVFWGMVSNNLNVYGVTRTVSQRDGVSTAQQDLQLELGAVNAARSITTVNKVDNAKKTKVVTETIGTPNQNFVRYTTIESQNKNEKGQKPNSQSLVNIWSKEPTKGNESIFSQAVFATVPFAQLSKNKRNEIINQMRATKVYSVDYANAKETIVNGKRAYRFTVNVKIKPYVAMLQKVDDAMNLGKLGGASAQDNTVELRMSVAIDSRQLLQVQYANNTREENYTGYGIQPRVKTPVTDVSHASLEQKLQTLLSE